MKKYLVMVIILLFSCAYATAASAECTTACIEEILNTWKASTPGELHENICQYWMDNETHYPDAYAAEYRPCNIMLGVTTQDLVNTGNRWDLAIVSSKDVDLEYLVDHGLIADFGFCPDYELALHQWRAREHLQAMLPEHPLLIYFVYFYDYDEVNDEATLLICRDRRGESFATEILRHRSASQVRRVERIRGITSLHDSAWRENEMLSHSSEWDYAQVSVFSEDDLICMTEAELLFDFSSNNYFASRDGLNVIWDGYRSSPSGIYRNGKMVGIPCCPVRNEYGNQELVLVVNAQSPYVKEALRYAEHYIKSVEWSCEQEHEMIWPYSVCIYKDKVDW